MDTPITIGITCYREGPWLHECWESVLAQSDPRWQAILVMDGGADQATRGVFGSLEHPKLRREALTENGGPYPTRNRAFAMTETPYHFYVDGDDRLPVNAVKDTLAAFERSPDAGFVYGDLQYFGEREFLRTYPKTYEKQDFVHGQVVPGAAVYRTEVWRQVGGFAEALAYGNGDYDFHLSLAEAGIRGVHCGSVFYACRCGHESTSGSYTRDYHRTHEIMVERHPVFFEQTSWRQRFLAAGYRKAALANLGQGHGCEAKRLARMAIAHHRWWDARMLAVALLPCAFSLWLKRCAMRLRSQPTHQAVAVSPE